MLVVFCHCARVVFLEGKPVSETWVEKEGEREAGNDEYECWLWTREEEHGCVGECNSKEIK